MPKNKDPKKPENVRSTDSAGKVRKTSSVTGVHGVQKASSIKEVSKVSSVRESTRTSSLDFNKRDKYFSMISEEAEKLVKEGVIPKSSQEVIERAVQMAIDASLLEPSDKTKDKKRSKTDS